MSEHINQNSRVTNGKSPIKLIIRSFLQKKNKSNKEITELYEACKSLMENEIKRNNVSEKEYAQIVDAVDKIYTAFMDEEFRKHLVEDNINTEQFIETYGERVFGIEKYMPGDFFKLVVNSIYMRAKSGKYENEFEAEITFLINSFIREIREKDPINDYHQIEEMAEKFSHLVKNPNIEVMIRNGKLNKRQLIDMCKEKILEMPKRTYDMSKLFNGGAIRIAGYKPINGASRKYLDNEGNIVIIQRIGELGYYDINIGKTIAEYKVIRQFNEDDCKEYNIFSNIQIINMDNPQYRQAVLSELLGKNNIELSNAGGYVGGIIANQNESDNIKIGEETTIRGSYYYGINHTHMLEYNRADLSAVILFERYRNIQEAKKRGTISSWRKGKSEESKRSTNGVPTEVTDTQDGAR